MKVLLFQEERLQNIEINWESLHHQKEKDLIRKETSNDENQLLLYIREKLPPM